MKNKKVLSSLIIALAIAPGLVLAATSLQGGGSSCSYVFSKTLKVGVSNTEVMNLQKLLNMSTETQVAASGPGSPGMESNYFGTKTKAAVIKFQEKYASQILTPNGLSRGTGLIGAGTRGKLNAMCSAANTTITPPTQTTQQSTTNIVTPTIPTPVLPAINIADTISPSVSLSSPSTGSTLNGTVTVSANASDNVGVVGVQFLLDGVSLGSEDTSSPYNISWDTTGVTNSTHLLSVRVRDAAGNQTISSLVGVTVSNTVSVSDTTAPTVSISSPSSGSSQSGTISVAATASDNIGVAGVQFLLDGASLGSEDTSSPYGISWDTTNVANGTHTLSARVRDAAGNQTTSSAVSVTLSNAVVVADTTAPVVSLSAPAIGASVSGTITITASASDNVGVTSVTFIADGGTLATVSSAPYSTTWDTVRFTSNGTHVLSAIAHDAAGNVTTSSSVNITVNNVIADVTPPSVSFYPANGSTLIGNRVITASVSDNTGVTGVKFYIDGTLLGAEVQSYPYTQSLATADYSSGSHALAVVARDAAGNAATSTGTIYIYKTRPTLTAHAPWLPTTILSTGTKTIGKVTIAADAAGPVAWKKWTVGYSKSSNVTLNDFQILVKDPLDWSGTLPLLPVANISVSSTGNTITFTSSADQEITGSQTYYINATVSGSLQSGDFVTTSAQKGVSQYSAPVVSASVSSSASFVWSDKSISPHSDTSADWNDDYSASYSTEPQTMTAQ